MHSALENELKNPPKWEDPETGLLTPEGMLCLEKTWERKPGFLGWLMEVNHAEIGKRYIVTAFCFFVAGGILALLMRIQLMRPENNFMGPDLYNQIFTVHGTTMMFLFAVPVMQGFAIYLVPLMIGARNVAFPKMNAFGYYVYLCGGLFLFLGLFLNTGPDAGWFTYVPLAGPEYSPGKRVDVWAQMITFTEIAGLIGAVEIVATILKMRTAGMTMNRLPLYVWTALVQAFMIIFSMPSIVLDSLYLAMDRLISTHFFNPAEGGDAMLWQHMFWFFGHPEVYIIFVPALGFISCIIQTFTRRKIYGRPVMVLSVIATGFLGFGLWVHHMFATSVPSLGHSYFTVASMMIALPTGAQIFCWIATIRTGKLRITTPMLFVLGFFWIFILGGLSGIMLASVPLDLQVHDTFFVIAHFHYVLIGGTVFPLLGAVYYWFPKMTGRFMSEAIGRWNVALLFIGFNLTFFPMHMLGMHGMPRRVYTYLTSMGWQDLNLLATVGAFIMALGVLLFAVNVAKSLLSGERAGDNPWDADSLEWYTTSPPKPYSFVYHPVVLSSTPLWDTHEEMPVVTGLRVDRREVLITSIDGVPTHRLKQPEPSIMPLISIIGVSVAFGTGIFTPWAIPVGIVLTGAALIKWYFEQAEAEPGERQNETPEVHAHA